MLARLAPSLWLLLLASGLSAKTAEEARPAFRCQERVADGVIAAVSPEGEVRLADGSAIRLADIRLPPEGEAGRHARAWLGSLGGSPVRIREVGPPDRWGRAAAHLELPGQGRIDIGELLVAEGLAVVDPGQRDLLCRPELLAGEARARQSRLGLWREWAWPIRATALDALGVAVGSFAIVEGRVVSVGERRERTYLNFGRDWSRDFNVTIPRRSWDALQARGITAASLTGRTVRVRGILEKRRTPTLDLTVPDMLEIVDGTGRRSAGE
jgi:endonuclease YncB( thermonuclease family)